MRPASPSKEKTWPGFLYLATAIRCARTTASVGRWPSSFFVRTVVPTSKRYRHQLTPELAPAVSRADAVIFVDSEQGGTAGEIGCREVRSESMPHSFTHHLTPGALLALSSELFGACPRAYLLSIHGENYAAGQTLSPLVEARLPDLQSRLLGLIQQNLASTPIAC